MKIGGLIGILIFTSCNNQTIKDDHKKDKSIEVIQYKKGQSSVITPNQKDQLFIAEILDTLIKTSFVARVKVSEQELQLLLQNEDAFVFQFRKEEKVKEVLIFRTGEYGFADKKNIYLFIKAPESKHYGSSPLVVPDGVNLFRNFMDLLNRSGS